MARLIIVAVALTLLGGCCLLKTPAMSSYPSECIAVDRPNTLSIPYVGNVTQVSCMDESCQRKLVKTTTGALIALPSELSSIYIMNNTKVFLNAWEVCLDDGSGIQCARN
jgi:hypothetical protein